MTILVFTTAYEPLTGGAELAVKYIAEHLPQHTFHILTAKQERGLLSFEDKGHIKIYRLGLGIPLDRHLFVFLAPLFYFYSLSTTHYSLSWAMMANQSAYAAYICKKLFKLKYLLSIQEGDGDEWFKKRERLPFYKNLYQAADKIQAISNFLVNRAKRYSPASQPVLVANGFNDALFRPVTPEQKDSLRAKLGLPSDAIIFFTASRLVKKNGIDLALQALLLSDARHKIVVAGEGEERKNLEALTNRLGLAGRVTFLGDIGQDMVAMYMQASDVFMRLSRSEGLGSVFLEAQGVGLPVLATTVGGIPDIVKDNFNGLLVPPESPEAAAKAMQALQDHNLRSQLSAAALEFSKEYTWKYISEHMEKLFLNFHGREF
ncbi:MAG TPA: glycosyltransferase family 4 protein [Patescibacteria group bacterium]|nr:glycosyltransferase family 4 protein [Patescibacteria group bacterium]